MKNISLIIPVHNEAESLPQLFAELESVVKAETLPLSEVIVIDDGSTDDTEGLFSGQNALKASVFDIQYIRLAKQSGKSRALSVGFARAQSDAIATMDGDLQDDPKDLPILFKKLLEGYDLVSGWKKNRKDPISKTIPSKFYNFVLRKFSGLNIRDFNCGLKIYRREAVKRIRIRGDMHRYIPVILSEMGYRVTDIATNHRPRIHGKSKYGIRRLLTGPLDFMAIIAVTRFIYRPGHFFGGVGLIMGLLGMAGLSYLGVLWCLDMGPIGKRPLLLISTMCVLLATQFIFFGILAELLLPSVLTKLPNVLIEKDLKLAK